jgi:hypothetical protein
MDVSTVRVGAALALVTLLFGFGLGAVFGGAEDALKELLVVDPSVVPDADKAKALSDKCWVYMKRAHMHAGGLGATALGISRLLSALPGRRRARQLAAAGFGVGALGYSVFWLLAGFRAPGLGSTGAAKESLAFLAIPSTALLVSGVLATLVLLASARLPRSTDA